MDKSHEVVLCGKCKDCPRILERLSSQLKSFLPDSVLLIPPDFYNYGIILYDGRIGINSSLIESILTPPKVRACMLMITILHELANFISMTYQGGMTYERISENYNQEAGNYLENQVFRINLVEQLECIDKDIASALLNWQNSDIKGILNISEKLSAAIETKARFPTMIGNNRSSKDSNDEILIILFFRLLF